MPSFRRVEGPEAGPNAVGILVPPGHRTLVILRPRALDVDLVLTGSRADSPGVFRFREIAAIEGNLMARQIVRALEEWAQGGPGIIEVVPLAEPRGWRIHIEIGSWNWAVCPRVPGQPYRAMTFTAEDEARALADRLAEVLCPSREGGQELYLNSQEFFR
jgi:hypothetical protein